MRLLLDMGIARRSAAALREVGVDAWHITEIGTPRMADADILQLAEHEDRCVVTRDADFSSLLATSGAARPSVMHIRLERIGYAAMAERIKRVLADHTTELETGAIASVTAAGVRIRRLPLAPLAGRA